jgi:hypothetical protein
VIDRSFEIKKFINFVRETYRISWKEIFWKVWAYLQVLECKACHQWFNLAEVDHCSFHSQKATFSLFSTPNEGM